LAIDVGATRGQATIETMLIAFLGVVFLSVAFQFYLVNRSVSRTLQEVHGSLLSGMWQYNNKSTKYDRETVKVIWTAQHGVPSASSVPRVGLLQDDLPEDLRIYSDWVDQHGDPDANPDCQPSSPPCKRTKAGGGLDAGNPWSLMGDGFSAFANGNYFEWLAYNAPNAIGDVTTLRDELQDVQELLEKYEAMRECLDDAEACARQCAWPNSNCPWDD
jgi:hypothetical protein